MTMKHNAPLIKHLFEPSSVAVIGASSDQGKIGYKVVDNIIASGFTGKLYPVNPKGGEIIGLKSLKAIEEMPEGIDLATIVIPAKFVLDTVKKCAAKKVKFLSIITSGFSEIGNLEEEKEIVRISQENGMRVLGPNIFGIYSAKVKMNATFGPKDVLPGGVAIVTQSGALGIAMIGKTRAENIGLSSIVSVGNKSDIDETELVDYLVSDDETKVILMYIEGIKNGENLVNTLKKATRVKPVIVIKSGSSKRGAAAAASHTGSLAGADEVFSDIMKQCGVSRASTIREGLNWCKFFSVSTMPKGENSVIITNGGGIGVLAADACEHYKVSLYDNVDSMKKAFEGAVPDFGSVKNPVDITGQATLEDYELSLNAALNHDDIHSVIVLGCETAVLNSERLTSYVNNSFDKYKGKKPIVFSFLGGTTIEKSIQELKSSGIPIFSDVYDAVSCFGVMYHEYNNHLTRSIEPLSAAVAPKVNTAKIKSLVDNALADGRNFLLAHEGHGIMEAAGIPMPQSRVAHNLDEAVSFAESIGYPVVMKIVSKDILHKSDAGGVALDLQTRDEVVDAYQAIMHSCRKYNKNAVITGIEVCEMIKHGAETIIGARIDGSFGPVIMFGLGGIYVEVMKDVSFRALPVTHGEALAMMKGIRGYPLLLGVRGEAKKDIGSIADVMTKVGQILSCCSDITDIEINPLVAYDEGEGVKAVDVRVLIKRK